MRTLFMMVGLTALGSLAGLAACGSGSPSQMSARDQATTASCDYYTRCNLIGDGLQFSSLDDCETKVRGLFQSAWTPTDCTMISSGGFDNCLTAIHIADCGNPADVANVLLNKCTKMNVCGTP
jgi:hypothetical protein